VNSKDSWFLFGIGFTLGLSVSLLTAPKSGKATRKQVREGVETAGNYLGDATDRVKAMAEKYGSEAHDAIDRTHSKFNDIVDSAADLAAAVANSAKSLV
jgi:gas vesicle protein